MFKVIYIMGVSGSGKTTIGQQLSAATGYVFYDADNFHTKENVAKMHTGIALTDEDRWPWLKNINYFVTEKITTANIIFGCSALKKVYRNHLGSGIEDYCRWVYLKGDYDTILERLNFRTDHFMPPALLQSQFDALEIPEDAIQIDIRQTHENIIAQIIKGIH